MFKHFHFLKMWNYQTFPFFLVPLLSELTDFGIIRYTSNWHGVLKETDAHKMFLCTTGSLSPGQKQQRLHLPINKHKDIMFQAVQSNNCSGDFVLTILWRRTFSFAFHLASLFLKNLNVSVVLPGSWFLCTNTNGIGSLVVHWRTFAWQSRIMVGRLDTGREREERERERGPPASCPGFVYNKKPLFDVVAQPAPKLPLPQDVLWVKCQTEATAGWLRPHHTGTPSKVLVRSQETLRKI